MFILSLRLYFRVLRLLGFDIWFVLVLLYCLGTFKGVKVFWWYLFMYFSFYGLYGLVFCL